ncbi:MAG: hypothetical protein IT270_18855 [Saprospiraceae bacterium]|nr:hypothetical protein [Saprospiraceae bacterium]
MQTIADVLERLDTIVAAESERESPMGYFPAFYCRIAECVRQGIRASRFENGARMDRLCVLFSRRYFDAYDNWYAGKPCSKSWQVAFDASNDDTISVVQHLMLGLNAHLNLDLTIAAAETRSGEAIFGLRPDFERINDIIAEITDRATDTISESWLPYPWLSHMVRTEDEGWMHFSLKTARGASWRAATALALTTDKASETAIINKLDQNSADLAKRIVKPGRVLQMGVNLMSNHEKGNNSAKIALLRNL